MQPTYNASGINGLGTVSFAAGGGSATSSTLVASLSSTAVTVFIVNTPSASNGGLAGIWGQYFNGDGPVGIRANSSTAWDSGTGGNSNDFTGTSGGTSGSMALNGGSLQTGNVSFTAGVPQVLEAIGNTSLSHTGIYDLGTVDYSRNRAYTGLIGEVVTYSSTLTTAQAAAVNAYLDAKWLNIGTIGGSNFLPTSTVLNLSGAGATVNLGYGSQTVAELSGVAGSSVVFGINANTTLTTGGDNNSTTFAGTISGDGGLTKTGAGMFTLTGSNTYTGPTSVSGGTLSVGNGGSGESLPSTNVTLSNAATLMFNHSDALAYNGTVSGSGSVLKTGPGTLALGGNNAQTGGLTVNGGVVTVNTAQSYGGTTTISAGTLSISIVSPTMPNIAGLAYLLDASNSGSLIASSGTLRTAQVSAWNDLSSNGVNFNQSTGGVQPTYVANGINGLAAVSFSGTNFSANTILTASNTASVKTVFVVGTPSAVNDTNGNSVSEIWGMQIGASGSEIGIRAASSSSWLNGTAMVLAVSATPILPAAPARCR